MKIGMSLQGLSNLRSTPPSHVQWNIRNDDEKVFLLETSYVLICVHYLSLVEMVRMLFFDRDKNLGGAVEQLDRYSTSLAKDQLAQYLVES